MARRGKPGGSGVPLTAPEMSRRGAATRAFLDDEEQVQNLIDSFAEGAFTMAQFCRDNDYAYATVQRAMKGPRWAEAFEAAQQVRAEVALELIEATEEAVLRGTLDPKQGDVALKSLWRRVEALSPRRYGPRQTVDHNVTDNTKLHMEAMRLAARTLRPDQRLVGLAEHQPLPVGTIAHIEGLKRP